MIEVKNLKKKFKKTIEKNKQIEFLADDDISFSASKGEVLGILGPNGAGKTTLLRMIAGIMEPTSGTVTIDGMNYKNKELEIKKQIAFLSGNTRIYKDISAYELLTMCGHYYGITDDVLVKRIEELAEEFDMKSFMHQKIENLSTGQTQRVNLARCVVHNPNYYILDEATSGLDTILSQIILNFIKKEKEKGKCVLYSTHYMEEAENICDRVIIVNKGKLIASGTPEEIKKKTKTTNLRDAFFNLIGGVSDDK